MFLKIMNILKQNIDTLSLICLNIICSPFKALLDKYPLFRKKTLLSYKGNFITVFS